MTKRRDSTPGYARLLEAWTPPPEAGEPIGCVATSFTFSSVFFEEECLGRFVQLETDAEEDGAAFLVEREEKLSQLKCAAALVDQRHAKGLRSLRWDLLPARIPGGILHAKISLLHWTNSTRLIVASANLTEDGYRRNHEVFGVLDYFTGSSAPLKVLDEIIEFLRTSARYVDPEAAEPNVAVARWQAFLQQVKANTREWGSAPAARTSAPAVHALLTGPDRPNLFEGIDSIWRGASPPDKAWVISPFFDPPEAPNAPAREIWNHLRQRGEAEVTYLAAGETPDESGAVRLFAPESLRWHPPQRKTTVSFERLEIQATRPLHAKCLWFEGGDCVVYVCGSSNFTSAGLGLGKTRNLEANLAWAIDTRRHREAARACNDAWLKSLSITGKLSLIPLPEGAEDSAGSDDGLLPTSFGAATLTRENDGSLWIEFSFHGSPPAGWQALPEDEAAPFLSEESWASQGRPAQLRVRWMQNRPPAGFRVIWPGSHGAAWWPVNIRDGFALPPPAELCDLPLEVLIEILTSAKPLHLAIRRWLQRKATADSGNTEAILDPHQRVDTSTFLLQRSRRVSWALAALRGRLERPAASIEALDWRLKGPIGVEAIGRAIKKEACSPEERAFLLAELMLELTRVRPTEIPGGLTAAQIRARLRAAAAELKQSILAEPLTDSPALHRYLLEAADQVTA